MKFQMKFQMILEKQLEKLHRRLRVITTKNAAKALVLAVLLGFSFGMGVVVSGKDISIQKSVNSVVNYLKNLFWIKPHYSSEPSFSSGGVYQPQTLQEEAVINAVKKASPAVVSVIVIKKIAVYKQYFEDPFRDFRDFFGDNFPFFDFRIPHYKKEGSVKRQVAAGTGFIISDDGLILTNKHVVSDRDAEYKIVTNDGRRYNVDVLAVDPFQDLAVLKIKKDPSVILHKFPTLSLGDSSSLQIGQTVIAIGNALGEFRNTVSVGVVSGLGRRITASGGGIIESLENVIQTDAAINPGNSGGPLLNLKGEVIGVNVAVAQNAQGIGFAIPINDVKRVVFQVKTLGRIVYPFLGLRYVLVTPELQEELNLSVDYGALVVRGSGNEPAVVPGSAADKAGIKEGDIILKVDGQKITPQNSLSKIIQRHSPGDQVTLEILRDKKTIVKKVVLGEKSSQ